MKAEAISISAEVNSDATTANLTSRIAVQSQFLSAIFQPTDTILLRPIETWTESETRKSRVLYSQVQYVKPLPIVLELALPKLERIAATEHANIFFGVCPRFGNGGRFDLAWQIRTIRTLWVDIDHISIADALAKIAAAQLPQPSIVVNSGNGGHFYWLLDSPILIDDVQPSHIKPPAIITQFADAGSTTASLPATSNGKKPRPLRYYLDGTVRVDLGPSNRGCPPLSPKAQHIQDICQGIAHAVGGDSTHDLARLLRIPGTLNRKNGRNGQPPTACELVELDSSRRYSIELFRHFAASSPAADRRRKIAAIKLPPVRKLKATDTKRQAKLSDLINCCGTAEDRSHADFDLCCFAIKAGIPQGDVWSQCQDVGKFAQRGDKYFQDTWDKATLKVKDNTFVRLEQRSAKLSDFQDHASESDSLPRKLIGTPSPSTPTLATAAEKTESPAQELQDDPFRLAHEFIKHHNATFKFWRDKWYEYTGSSYDSIRKSAMESAIAGDVKRQFDSISRNSGGESLYKTGSRITADVLHAMKSICSLSDSVGLMEFTGVDPGRRPWLAMQNGILDVDAYLSSKGDVILPHTHDWFSTVCLPYNFDQTATSPALEKFLIRNLEGDPERIAVLQEFAGYLLLPDLTQQKFLALEGRGGDGKSVFCALIEALLGKENCSAVDLEKFDDKFQLAPTLGKLVAIAADCSSEIEKPAEGTIKRFSSGDNMRFEFKGKDPFSAVPTARLIICFNNRPHFSDKTDAIWRRLLLVPFRTQMAEGSAERILGMNTSDWWMKSGEMPGVLNWALAGLDRLRRQGSFSQSKISDAAKTLYRMQMNPAIAFILENYEYSEGLFLKTGDVYEAYKAWSKNNGYYTLGNNKLGEQILLAFDGKVKNIQQREGNTKPHFYSNMTIREDSPLLLPP